jgi:hypothetical protein
MHWARVNPAIGNRQSGIGGQTKAVPRFPIAEKRFPSVPTPIADCRRIPMIAPGLEVEMSEAKKGGFPEGSEVLFLAIALFLSVIGLMGLMMMFTPK